ncbi:MAG: polyprenyl glycosylphosphotransferase, partial [Candidatus Portnoybacteria bacterium CG10_big_fil_rev_8_21_14_0_10_36_7]
NLLLRKEAFRTNTLFIGNSIEAQEIIAKIQSNPQLGYNAKLQISTKQINNAIELAAIINEHQIKVIVVADDPHANQKLAKILFQCLPFQINIYDLPVFYEKITGKIPINAINQMWFLENLVESEYGSYETIKRFLDIILATSFSIILLILSPIITVLVKLSSKGPIFYSQTRIGKNEKPFKLTKYRSMIHNAETNKPQWTTQGDSRVTTIGKFLRRTFLDELPQLFSIIKGEMSFVGPRPERPEFVEQLEKTIPFYQMRHIVKPGLTGWAQISYRYGSSVEDSTEKLKYDLYYIKNRSIALDIGIVLKTIKLIFKER